MIPIKQQIDNEIYLRRCKLKEFYKSEMGLDQIEELVLAHKIGQELRSMEDVAIYNLGIKRLEEIGILDEEGLKPTLAWMLSQGEYKRPVEEKG